MRSSVSGIQIPTAARLNIDGEFTLDAAAGTSGYMLVSQGAGNTPAWSNTLTSPTITTSLVTGSTSFNLLTTTATTINFGLAATTMNIATNNVAKTINLGTGGSGGNQVDVNIGTNASATTSNINLYGQTVLGKSTTSATTVSGFGTTLTTQGTSNTGTTGNATGSNLQIYSGAASLTNASNITGTATSGNLLLDVGSASVASIDAVAAYGNVQIAPSSASAVTIGRAGITTTVNGTLSSADAKLNNPLLTSISTVGGGGLEGGQINFARVTDGATYWNIDSYGSTSTPDLRIIENATERFKIASGGAVTNNGEILLPRAMLFAHTNSPTSSGSTAASAFQTANDVLSGLAVSTFYRFRAKYYVSYTYAGVASLINLLFTFSNAPTAIKYSYETRSQTAGSTAVVSAGTYSTTAASAVIPTQSASGSWTVSVDGYFATNATTGGTLTPQFSVSGSSSTGNITTGSWIEVEKLGTSSASFVSGSWA